MLQIQLTSHSYIQLNRCSSAYKQFDQPLLKRENI
jgi:hypothetical protein